MRLDFEGASSWTTPLGAGGVLSMELYPPEQDDTG